MADVKERPKILEPFLTKKELAAELDVCTKTVERLEEKGLPVIRLGRRPLYDPKKVRDWISAQ